jgi:hypothetical protein
MNTRWPFDAARLERAEAELRALLADEQEMLALLDVALPQRLQPLVAFVEALDWSTPEQIHDSAEKALHFLLEATKPGGLLDPRHESGEDLVWAVALRKVGATPVIGAKLARAWFHHLERLAWEGEDGSVATTPLAVAAYACSLFQLRAGRPERARRYFLMAGFLCDHDDRAGLGLVLAVRAGLLLRGL